jgi:hypothetical protein
MTHRYTRATILGVAGSALAALLIERRLRTGGTRRPTASVPPPPYPRPGRLRVEADFLAAPGEGWGDSWLPALYDRRLRVSDGAARLEIPDGRHTAAQHQPMAVMLIDRCHNDGEQLLEWSVDDETVGAGLLLRATSTFDFVGITVEGDELVIANYRFDQRTEVARAVTFPIGAGDHHHLQVRYHGSRVWARAWPEGTLQPSWQIEAQAAALERGNPGILVIHPGSHLACTLSVYRHLLLCDEHTTPTAPTCPVLISGIQEAIGGGRNNVRLRGWSAYPTRMVFEWSADREMSRPRRGPELVVDRGPYTAVQQVEIPVGRWLFWRVRMRSLSSDAQSVTAVHRIRVPSSDEPFTLFAASCYKLIGPLENDGYRRLLEQASGHPAALVFEGDFGYAGNIRDAAYAALPDYYADRFQRFLCDPGFVAVRRSVSTGFIMDDHDYGRTNNATRTSVVPWTMDLWNEISADPTTTGYFDFRFGDIHCLTLDCRRYSDRSEAPDSPSKTRLGTTQREWMEHLLRHSDAEMFVLFSAGIFASRAKVNQRRILDCFLYGWPDEYRWAMTLFTDIQLSGKRVLIVSGDAHSLRVHNHPDPLRRTEAEGMRVTEFVCSGIRADSWSGATLTDPTLDRTRYRVGVSGAGLVEIGAPSDRDRQVTLRAITADPQLAPDAWSRLVLPFRPS